MVRAGAWSLAVVLAFVLGWSGLPGKAMAWVTTRMLDEGTIALDDAVEPSVRQALLLEEPVDEADPSAP